ncbi:uncharacterized protein [Nicotiana sylvestris]|uniref:Uncharacterized protein LOC104243081 isoform X2 n=1 Tax=Nicotiana sylvestris TaxID=4096 RepID=A0A1U7YCL0_NICSY|nr:PREDICTED: uncharacterized protein LOC104243081 isoform X2 [Nicotiana sylvestris]XP_009796519.1 PREDICTED: uncharacterized protein LOC104243081 isoform X2 [Nicotiana sylvestris]XP_009796520.1 PREDICTED: uncharacterized protein LOC104243081 isoform X2 [Nicotiana sylvestris]XP_009796521.1 PREDICTED: uncharacterized protein LOC104243081 isoform X2 [Nicotiana sylvestris]
MSTNEDVASRRDEEAKEQRRRDRNLRRRTRYAQMSPERKQSFLLKLQAKRAKSKRRRLNPHSSNTLSLMETGTQSQRQSALTVGDCPLDSEEGHASEATNMPVIIDKGNNMIDCLSIFEDQLQVHVMQEFLQLQQLLHIENTYGFTLKTYMHPDQRDTTRNHVKGKRGNF